MFERHVIIALLSSMLGLGGCATSSQGPSGTSSSNLDNRAQPYTAFGADEFSDHTINAWKQYAKIAKAINGAEGNAALQNANLYSQYRSSGVAYVDRKCGEYFQALHLFHKKKREAANTSNIVVGGITAIMGALRSAAKEIASVAVFGTATTAFIENYDSALLYSLDPATTRSLVAKAQAAYLGNSSTASPNSFQDALLSVQGYADLCMPATIERLVNEAIKSGTPKTTPISSIELLRDSSSKVARDNVAAALGVSVGLADNDLLYLYWLMELSGAADDKERAHIKVKLPTQVQTSVYDGNGDIRAAVIPKLRAALGSLAVVDSNFASAAKSIKDEEGPKIAAQQLPPKAGAPAQQGAGAPPPQAAAPVPVTPAQPALQTHPIQSIRPHVFF